MDVAARNVLVHSDNLVKIADFGLVGQFVVCLCDPLLQLISRASCLVWLLAC